MNFDIFIKNKFIQLINNLSWFQNYINYLKILIFIKLYLKIKIKMENPNPAKPRKYLFTLKHYIKDS